jgi:hypothetical protein
LTKLQRAHLVGSTDVEERGLVDITLLIIIVAVLLLVGGGGFYGSRRWR